MSVYKAFQNVEQFHSTLSKDNGDDQKFLAASMQAAYNRGVAQGMSDAAEKIAAWLGNVQTIDTLYKVLAEAIRNGEWRK